MAARCFVAAVLLLLQALAMVLGQPMQPAAVALSAGYVVATLLAARFAPFKPIRGVGRAWLSTIGVDLVTFTALQVMQVGSINYSPLFALPVLMGAVLGTSAVASAPRRPPPCCCWRMRPGSGWSSPRTLLPDSSRRR